jgi:cyclopropane-fatty-acyl-phospholipid synthase
MFYRAYADKFFKVFDRITCGNLRVTTPDGKTRAFSGPLPGAKASMHIKDWRTLTSFAAKGDIGLAEAYANGWWDTGDLCALLLFGLENESALKSILHGNSFSALTANILYALRQNTLRGSRKNIQAHYDLGNEFYKLWLDPTMTYSSALYHNDNETLDVAQNNKYDRLLDRLENRSGRLLEVGCGWGGFAERTLTRQDHDFSIKGITLSTEQQKFAKDRLGNTAEIALQDYRHQTGKYDNIVSIEMFEAVGEKFWPTYFEKLKSLLAQNGKAMIQTITIDEQHFYRYRKGGDMIRTYIFPGGMLPSPSRFVQEAAKANLNVTDQFAFGQDYAKTVLLWLQAFNQNADKIKALGYDEKFMRLWRFYLAVCYAAFKVERINVMHMELQHA